MSDGYNYERTNKTVIETGKKSWDLFYLICPLYKESCIAGACISFNYNSAYCKLFNNITLVSRETAELEHIDISKLGKA